MMWLDMTNMMYQVCSIDRLLAAFQLLDRAKAKPTRCFAFNRMGSPAVSSGSVVSW